MRRCPSVFHGVSRRCRGVVAACCNVAMACRNASRRCCGVSRRCRRVVPAFSIHGVSRRCHSVAPAFYPACRFLPPPVSSKGHHFLKGHQPCMGSAGQGGTSHVGGAWGGAWGRAWGGRVRAGHLRGLCEMRQHRHTDPDTAQTPNVQSGGTMLHASVWSPGSMKNTNVAKTCSIDCQLRAFPSSGWQISNLQELEVWRGCN